MVDNTKPRKKVLVVDDEQSIAHIIRDFLNEKGYAVTVAYDGEGGYQAALKDPPDVVILDVELPDTSGYEVCQRMRQLPSLRNTPIIMLTVRAGEEDELKGLKSGADDYLTKPFMPARLLARLQTAIDRNVRELDANPLTHLPGNTSILQEIENRIDKKEPFAVLYIDLNNFKAFNDRYGFVKGDQVIRFTAELLSSCVISNGRRGNFLGHVGGDDFVAIVAPEDAEETGGVIIARFDGSIPGFYDSTDRERGYIETVDRRGNPSRFPLMGVAVAVVSNVNRPFNHPGEVALVAGELKKWAKTKGKSACVVDRRTG